VCNQKVTLIPPTDANRAKMLRCGLYQKNMWALLSNVPAGDYEVYLYVWENDWPETYSLFIENKLVVKNYNSRGRGYWDKLGPFAVRINDGDIEIGSKGWWSNLSGIEVWRVDSAVNNAAESDNSEQAPTFEPKSK